MFVLYKFPQVANWVLWECMSTAGMIVSENTFLFENFMCKYSNLKFYKVIKIENFVVNYNIVFHVLCCEQKRRCASIYFALYRVYSILPYNYFLNSDCHSWGKEKLMYDITASLFLGLNNIWVCVFCLCFWQLCYLHVVYGHPSSNAYKWTHLSTMITSNILNIYVNSYFRGFYNHEISFSWV